MIIQVILLHTMLTFAQTQRVELHDGQVEVRTDESCSFMINGKVYNTTGQCILPGLHFGMIKYDCNGYTGYMISKLKCKQCGIFCYENELIDGCQQNIAGMVIGFGMGTTVFLTCYVLTRKFMRRMIHGAIDSLTKSKATRKHNKRINKIRKLRKLLAEDVEYNIQKDTVAIRELQEVNNSDEMPSIYPDLSQIAKDDSKYWGILAMTMLFLIGSAVGCDNTLYLKSDGRVCTTQSCNDVTTYEMTIGTGSTICFRTNTDSLLEIKLSELSVKMSYELMYYTSNYNIKVDMITNCKGAGECWNHGCMPDTVHTDLHKDNLATSVQYGCRSSVIGCDHACWHQSSCTWYRAEVQPYGEMYPVYKSQRSGWNSIISISYMGKQLKYEMNVNNPKLNLGEIGMDLPLIIKDVMHENYYSDNGMTIIDGKGYKLQVSDLNFPDSHKVGDIQVEINKNSSIYDISVMQCISESCDIRCSSPGSQIMRYIKNVKNYPTYPVKFSDNYYHAMTTTPMNGQITFLLSNSDIKNLHVEHSKCMLDVLTTYACIGCTTSPYAIIQAYNIKREGLLPFESNCTFKKDYVSCNEEPFLLELLNDSKHCKLYFATINKTMNINFEYKYIGYLDPTTTTWSKGTTVETVKSMLTNQDFISSIISTFSALTILSVSMSAIIKIYCNYQANKLAEKNIDSA